MLAKEVIEHLERFDEDSIVVVPGHGGGYNDVNSIFKQTVLKGNTYIDKSNKKKEKVVAIVIT